MLEGHPFPSIVIFYPPLENREELGVVEEIVRATEAGEAIDFTNPSASTT